MKKGIACYETYEGPDVDIIEFCLHDNNYDTRKQVASKLLEKTKAVSAHLPSFLPIRNIQKELEFDSGEVDYFVAHITKKSEYDDWQNSWKFFNDCGKKILIENHNQDWHPTDVGLCLPEFFKPIADAGYSLCLDLGHILYSDSCRTDSESEWRDLVEKHFEEFLTMPIEAVHVHTVSGFKGPDHQLDGFDISNWVKKIIDKNPNVTLMAEVMDPKYSNDDKLQALKKWIG